MDIAIGMSFLALAALGEYFCRRQSWLRDGFSGFAVGMGVVEGSDVAGLFSACLWRRSSFIKLVGRRGFCQIRNMAVGLRSFNVGCRLRAFSGGSIHQWAGEHVNQRGEGNQRKTPRPKPSAGTGPTQWSLPKRELLTLGGTEPFR